jgi:hypothetical protein
MDWGQINCKPVQRYAAEAMSTILTGFLERAPISGVVNLVIPSWLPLEDIQALEALKALRLEAANEELLEKTVAQTAKVLMETYNCSAETLIACLAKVTKKSE